MPSRTNQSSAALPLTVYRKIGRLVTMAGADRKLGRNILGTEDLSIIENAALAEVGGRVLWVGAEAEVLKRVSERGGPVNEVHFGGATVLPAFTECHTHLVYAGNRAAEFEKRNRGESYQSIAHAGGGILSTVRATRAASEDELTKIAQVRADRFLAQGVTTIEVKSGYGLTVESEMKMLKAAHNVQRARIVGTFLGAHALAPEFLSATDYVEHLMSEAFPKIRNEKLATRVDIFVENGYFDEKVARKYLLAAREHGFDLAIHADQLTNSGGARLAVELGARSAEHLIRITANEISALAKSDVTCVLLPAADLYMNCPYPPARALIDQGARVALATDFNPGTAPSQDLALGGVLARIQMKMTFEEVLTAYTVGAAHALGLGAELGALVPSKLCDFIVLDGELEELFFEIGRMPVARVVREGRFVV